MCSCCWIRSITWVDHRIFKCGGEAERTAPHVSRDQTTARRPARFKIDRPVVTEGAAHARADFGIIPYFHLNTGCIGAAIRIRDCHRIDVDTWCRIGARAWIDRWVFNTCGETKRTAPCVSCDSSTTHCTRCIQTNRKVLTDCWRRTCSYCRYRIDRDRHARRAGTAVVVSDRYSIDCRSDWRIRCTASRNDRVLVHRREAVGATPCITRDRRVTSRTG